MYILLLAKEIHVFRKPLDGNLLTIYVYFTVLSITAMAI